MQRTALRAAADAERAQDNGSRWQVFWQEIFPRTAFWKLAHGRLVPVIEIDSLPRALTEAFLSVGELGPAWEKLLRFLSPITVRRGLFSEDIA